MIKVMFSGYIKTVGHRESEKGGVLSLSLCQKNRGSDKDGAEASFTWLNITVFKPSQFLLDKAVKGSYITGVGDFKLRTFDAKDGTKKTSADVICSSFDLDLPNLSQHEPQDRPMKDDNHKSAGGDDGGPPF